MQVRNAYEHLVKGGHIGPQKVRVHVKKVVQLVAKYLSVDHERAEPIARKLILEARREYWIDCLKVVTEKDGLSLSEKIENALDSHYLRQSGDIWGDIRTIIAGFNSQQDEYQLPTDKSNIALSLNATRSITLAQFISFLSLSPNYMRHKQGETTPNLGVLWRDSLGVSIMFQNRSTTLKQHLIGAIYSGLPTVEWKENILAILQSLYTQTGTNLGYTSWTTLSRGIKGSSGDYISQDDFRRFIQSDALN